MYEEECARSVEKTTMLEAELSGLRESKARQQEEYSLTFTSNNKYLAMDVSGQKHPPTLENG